MGGRVRRRYGGLIALLVMLSACGVGGPAATPTLPFRTATPPPSPTPRAATTPRVVATLEPTATAGPVGAATAPPGQATPEPGSSVATRVPSGGTATAGATTAVRPAFSGENALRHVEELSISVGPRPVGTEGESKAADYIADQLAAIGYTVSRQPFSVQVVQDLGSRLAIDGDQRPITPLVMQQSGTNSVDGPLASAGSGEASDLATVTVRDRILLVERGRTTFQEKARLARQAGAIGLIIYDNTDQSYPFLGDLREAFTLPVVAIRRADGLYLRQQLDRRGTLRVSLRLNVTTESKASANLEGILPGRGLATRPIIIVGAHYDSVANSPGANDNGSGVGLMLEMARVMAREQRAEFRFVAFGAEEVGLVGSRAYIERLTAAERARILAMINFDMLAVGQGLMVAGSEDLVARTLRLAEQAQIPRVTRLGSSVRTAQSDHTSFLNAGISAIFFHRPEDPNYHSGQDRAQFVSLAALQTAGNLSARLIDNLVEQRMV